MIENGNRELGVIQANLQNLSDQLAEMRQENRESHREFHEAINAISSEGYGRRIDELKGRVEKVEQKQDRFWRDTVATATGVSAVVTFVKSMFVGGR